MTGLPIRVLQIGLGPIGVSVGRLILEKQSLKLIGAVDIDPMKAGRDVGYVLGVGELGFEILSEVDSFLEGPQKPDVAVVTTVSSFEKLAPLLIRLFESGIHVVTTCEEMVFPWFTHSDLAKKLDQLATSKGVSALATGVNPGFLMDFLPVTFSAVCGNIMNIYVERIQDAQFRRLPFQKKIGMGLTREEFFVKVKEGALRHVGLVESMHLIASKLGWTLDRVEDSVEPVIATRQVFFGDIFIAKGDILGVNQTGKGFVDGKEMIKLYFRATVGEPEPMDRIVISGGSTMEMVIKNGLNGDTATCSIIVNAIHVIVEAKKGLRTMADIEPISFYP